MSITQMHDGRVVLHQADCRDVLRGLADNSIDSVVTDPPYALVSIVKRFGKPGSAPAKDVYGRGAAGFMGKQWNTGEVAFSEEFWAEVLRVLKPGGHVVAFSGTRTYHRMAVAIEDAGFEIRDQLGWVYGSGFPKSHNQHGDWEGWGTALKPAWEPIALARKPLAVPQEMPEGEVYDADKPERPVKWRSATVAENLAEWGVGAIHIDGCRIESDDAPEGRSRHGGGLMQGSSFQMPDSRSSMPAGRWPANIVHDGSDEVLAAFPDAPGQQGKSNDSQRTQANVYGATSDNGKEYEPRIELDKSAARFFYCAKASRADRDAGLSTFETKTVDVLAGHRSRRMEEVKRPDGAPPATGKNTHPTVKPTTLMQWLCRLITPPGGVILDPFMGSGSTGKAAVLEGFQFIGCEREDEYMPIATARIAWAIGATATEEQPAVAQAQPAVAANDNDLFSRAA